MSKHYKIFIDDSADGLRKKYVVAGALIDTKEAWHAFTVKWKHLLRSKPAIPYFHAVELGGLHGPFKQFKDNQIWPPPSGKRAAERKRDLLVELIESSNLIAVGCAVLIPDYEKVRSAYPEVSCLSKDAFQFALQQISVLAVNVVKEIDADGQVSFVMDSSSRASHYEKLFERFLIANPVTATAVKSFRHLDDKKVPALQAADLCAATVKSAFDRFDEGTFVRPLPFFDKRFCQIAYMNESYLIEVIKGQSSYVEL